VQGDAGDMSMRWKRHLGTIATRGGESRPKDEEDGDDGVVVAACRGGDLVTVGTMATTGTDEEDQAAAACTTAMTEAWALGASMEGSRRLVR